MKSYLIFLASPFAAPNFCVGFQTFIPKKKDVRCRGGPGFRHGGRFQSTLICLRYWRVFLTKLAFRVKEIKAQKLEPRKIIHGQKG